VLGGAIVCFPGTMAHLVLLKPFPTSWGPRST
jgi:hypothetical protein